LGVETRRPQIFVCYDLIQRLTNEKEDLILETKPKLFSVSTIAFPEETISLLSVGIS
jgi:hypothetical protein